MSGAVGLFTETDVCFHYLQGFASMYPYELIGHRTVVEK
jgi:hypothetical protein